MDFESEYRGRRFDNEQWVFGDLIRRGSKPDDRIYFIYSIDEGFEGGGKEYQVFPDTVGVFTGLRDMNGTKIYESDKVEFYYKGATVECEVIWHRSLGMFCLKWKDGYINHYPLSPERYKVLKP